MRRWVPNVRWMMGPLGWGQGSTVITQRWRCETIFLFLSAPDWAKKETQCHSFLTTILCISRDVFRKKSCWGSIFKASFVSNTQTHQLTGFHLNKRVHMHINTLFIVGFMEFSDYSSGHCQQHNPISFIPERPSLRLWEMMNTARYFAQYSVYSSRLL